MFSLNFTICVGGEIIYRGTSVSMITIIVLKLMVACMVESVQIAYLLMTLIGPFLAQLLSQ